MLGAPILIGSVLAAGAPPAAGLAPPADLVQRFYYQRHSLLSSELPSAVQLQEGRKLLSNRLVAALISALKFQADWILSHPDEPSADGGPPVIYKPPFVDGDIFTGSPDGARGFVVSDPTPAGTDRWLVGVHSTPEPQMSSWSIAVVVIRDGNRLVIDDVLYDFAEDGSSQGSLLHYLSYRDED